MTEQTQGTQDGVATNEPVTTEGTTVESTTVDAAALEQLRAQANEYLEGWQRARAEFANYKKRIERDMKESYQNASADVLKDFLPILDDFERALANVPEELQGHPWISGVSMIHRKMNKLLEDYGVTIIEPTGQPFDPNLHEAVGMDDETEAASGTVTATMQKGYLVGERVLRPALVRVAR